MHTLCLLFLFEWSCPALTYIVSVCLIKYGCKSRWDPTLLKHWPLNSGVRYGIYERSSNHFKVNFVIKSCYYICFINGLIFVLRVDFVCNVLICQVWPNVFLIILHDISSLQSPYKFIFTISLKFMKYWLLLIDNKFQFLYLRNR